MGGAAGVRRAQRVSPLPGLWTALPRVGLRPLAAAATSGCSAGSSRAEGCRRSARSLAEAALSGPWVAAEVCLGRHANDALEVSAYFVQERNWN